MGVPIRSQASWFRTIPGAFSDAALKGSQKEIREEQDNNKSSLNVLRCIKLNGPVLNMKLFFWHS